MVAAGSSQIRFFRPASDETPNTNEWHMYREDTTAALCGEAQLSYNRDAIADFLPLNTLAHAACIAARDGIEVPAAEAKPAGPKPATVRRNRQRKAAKVKPATK